MNDDQGRRRGDRTTTLDDGEVAACPECDSSDIRTNSVGGMTDPADTSRRYQCMACHAFFRQYVVREKRHDASPGGLPGDLLAADPDEVTRFGCDERRALEVTREAHRPPRRRTRPPGPAGSRRVGSRDDRTTHVRP